LHQPGRQHRPRALQGLLSRLEDEHQPAPYRAGVLRQGSGDTDPDGGVQVVSAQVRDVGDARGEALVEDLARPWEGQRVVSHVDGVHVRPVHHRRAVRGTVEYREDAVAADTGRHLEPGRPQLLRDQPGRLPLLAGQFRVTVDLAAELDQFVIKDRHR
jgi:hypothetical protein